MKVRTTSPLERYDIPAFGRRKTPGASGARQSYYDRRDGYRLDTDGAARSLRPPPLLHHSDSKYSEKSGMEILQHGEDRLRNEPVPGRLYRPSGITAARSRALSSLDRARARPDRQCVRSPHVRGHAL